MARRAARRGVEVHVLLLPCTFASGQERAVAASMEGVTRVLSTREVMRLLVRPDARYPARTPLLHLGGDLMYTALLSWRLGWRSWSYLWGRRWWDSALAGYFVRNRAGLEPLTRRGIDERRAEIVGDLVVDGVLDAVPHRPEVDPSLISFLPGSREHEVASFAPLLLEGVRLMRHERPELRFQMMVSPFLESDHLKALLESEPHARVGGAPGIYADGKLTGPEGACIEIVRERQLEKLARSALAVSIPGTKTAEAATLGVPVLTVIPLNRPEILPSHGLIGLLHFIPGGGELLGRLLLRQRGRVGLLALPNQLAGEALLPEVIDIFQPSTIPKAVLSALQDRERLAAIHERLLALYGPLAGAADRMLDRML